MNKTRLGLALPRLKTLGVAAALACGAVAAHAGEGSSLVTSFSYSITGGGTLTWLDQYTSFSASVLLGGGLLGSKNDSYSVASWDPLIVGASLTGASAASSTSFDQTFWADALTSNATTTNLGVTQPNQATAMALQSGTFSLSQAGTVTFTVGYTLKANSAGGNTSTNSSSAAMHFNVADSDNSNGGDTSVLARSFDALSNTVTKTGVMTLSVVLTAGEIGYYTLDGSGSAFSPVTPVPEPGQWALMSAGLLGLGAYARRRSQTLAAA